MTGHRRVWLSGIASAALLYVAAMCLCQSIGLGTTAEDGLKYSVPAMRALPQAYSEHSADNAEATFRTMKVSADRWMIFSVFSFGLSIGACIACAQTIRSTSRQSEVKGQTQALS
jgi:hypothetical protein